MFPTNTERKRIRTLCGLNGYVRLESEEFYILKNDKWYRLSKGTFRLVYSDRIREYYKDLPKNADYEVMDISSYDFT